MAPPPSATGGFQVTTAWVSPSEPAAAAVGAPGVPATNGSDDPDAVPAPVPLVAATVKV